MELHCGISNISLWFKSYLSNRSQKIILGDSRSRFSVGVPQGSVLGPILYIPCTADILLLINKHDATGHLYADDIQAIVHGSQINQLALVSSIDALTRDLHSWISSNTQS